MKNTLLLSVSLFLGLTLRAQSSFQKSISLDTALLIGTGVCECPDGSLVMSGLTGQIVKLSPAGNLLWARQTSNTFGVFSPVCGNDGSINFLSQADGPNSNSHQLVVKMNADGQIIWDKLLDVPNNPLLEGLAPTSDGGCIATSGWSFSQDEFRYHKLSASGEISFAKSLSLSTFPKTRAVTQLASGDYLIGGSSNEPSGLLVRAGANGSPLWAKSFTGFDIHDVGEFPDGQLLVAGPAEDPGKIVFARLTAQGAVVWAKAIQNGGVVVNSSSSTTPDGGLLLRTGLGNQLMGFLKMDDNGSLQWARGYPAGNYQIGEPTATQDGGYLFLVPSYTLDSAGVAGIIKTDAEGLLPDCGAVDLCLDMEDFATTVTNIPWTEQDLNYDTAFQSSVSPLQMLVEDFCSPPVYPDPAFELPDSLCAGSAVNPTGLNQSTAGSWWWTFEGGNPENSPLQAPSNIVFSTPGQYEVRQVIRFGGCPDSFAVQLTVLPSPRPDLGPDTLLCESGSYLLDGTTADATTYLWENGDNGSLRTVAENGIYNLLVSNGFCETAASVSVRFFDETYPGARLDLGPDTTLCEGASFFPSTALPGPGTLVWDDGSTELPRLISQPGSYSATFFLENCPLEDEVNIALLDCSATAYAPTAFSPNGDGANEFFTLYGGSGLARIEELAVFDRWGGLLFRARDLPPGEEPRGWDGTRQGEPLPPGLYAWYARVQGADGGSTFLEGGVHLVR